MDAPVVSKPIPTQIVNELAAYGPFDLKDFITSSDPETLRFRAELKSGAALPSGMICTTDGLFTGIPSKDTSGNHQVLLTISNEAGVVQTEFVLVIKPGLQAGERGYVDKLKAQVWEAVEQHLPVPDLTELYEREITKADIYYLLERWATLKIWDAFNLEPPGALQELKLEGASEHYYVFDRGSCLVACPKDLFSHERTLEDGLQTARAMAREVYKRNWTIELVGYIKLSRAAWVELQHLGDEHGHRLDVLNYDPSPDEALIYNIQATERELKKFE